MLLKLVVQCKDGLLLGCHSDFGEGVVVVELEVNWVSRIAISLGGTRIVIVVSTLSLDRSGIGDFSLYHCQRIVVYE